ncbi:MAG TPA: efflux RND transporter periplasmic adaptor subunit [Thermoanaerobaculia bacterium]|nr:efflux RND transporter periplasmic adaptor subunit [Thermoanaerobaculia bacterium]HQR65974.1 efflux RND transporter periplasmic adaptor subunit [Thermoanaerobaculia bacterium]
MHLSFRIRLVPTSLLAAALLAPACAKKEAPVPPPPVVEVAPVIQKDVSITSEWISTLDGFVNAEIRSQVTGYLLKQAYRDGALVKKGELLFEIDPRQFQAAVDQAKGTLAQYKATLANAKTTVARYRPLAAQKAISQQELDDAVTQELTAQANVESAQANLEKAQLNLEWTRVVSPIDGIAGIAKAQVGDLVAAQTVLTAVSQVDPIKAYFNPSEQEYLAWTAKIGSPERLLAEAIANRLPANLELILSDGSVYPERGRAYLLGRNVDVKTGTIMMAGVFPNPGDILRPGQFGKIRLVTATRKGALLVPQRAVSELQGAFQVAVVGPDNKVEIKAVEPGERYGSLWVIAKGLAPGDKIVVEGAQKLRPGMAVNPKPAAPAAGAPAPEAGK